MATDLGQLLRKARTEKQMTLDELQEITKIRKRYLEAIEEGNYNVLPGNFYVRAFIKQYSEAVGLDPDEVFRLYAHAIPPAETESASEIIRVPRRRSSQVSDRFSKIMSALLLIAFPILILVVFYYYYWVNNEPDPNSVLPEERITDTSAAELEETEAQEPLPGEIPDHEPPVTAEEPEAEVKPTVVYVDDITWSKNTIQRYEVYDADTITVEMSFVGAPAWYGITHADSKKKYIHQQTQSEGETYAGEFDHDIYLNIGRADVVRLKVNGVEIELGDEPNPRRFQFELAQEKEGEEGKE